MADARELQGLLYALDSNTGTARALQGLVYALDSNIGTARELQGLVYVMGSEVPDAQNLQGLVYALDSNSGSAQALQGLVYALAGVTRQVGVVINPQFTRDGCRIVNIVYRTNDEDDRERTITVGVDDGAPSLPAPIPGVNVTYNIPVKILIDEGDITYEVVAPFVDI